MTEEINSTASKKYSFRHTEWICKKFFKKKGTVIDLGSGKGFYADAFERLGFKVYRVDLKNNISVDLETDLLPFKDETIDYCFCSHVIEHLHNPENMLSEVHRVLKNKGKFLIVTPDYKKMSKEVFYSHPEHINGYTKEKLHDTLSKRFTNVNVFEFSNAPIIWRFTLKSFDIYWKWKKYLFLIGMCEKGNELK